MGKPLEVLEDEPLEAGEINTIDMPDPVGWQLLVKPYKAETVSAGGIVLSDSVSNANKHMNIVGQVMKMGDLCYNDDRFKQGDRLPRAFCKTGDWVLYALNVGTKFNMYDDNNRPVELVLMNDDHIKAVVDDPKKIRSYV